MASVHPDRERLQAFLENDDGKPIVMINLLRFRERAEYPPDADFAPCSGAEIGPAEESWDEALLVEYPSRSAFATMVSDPDYQAAAVHRTAALADSRLIATTSEHAELATLG